MTYLAPYRQIILCHEVDQRFLNLSSTSYHIRSSQTISEAGKMDSFRPNRSLLNAKFEGYRLDPIPQEDVVQRYKLTRKPTQATTSGKIPLSFQEMRSRISHNHLSVESTSGRAIYVDENYAVCMIGVPTGKRVSFFR